MKRIYSFTFALVAVFIFSSCQKLTIGIINSDDGKSNVVVVDDNNKQNDIDTKSVSLSLKIVELYQNGDAYLAGNTEFDVYKLNLKDAPVFLDGKKADFNSLEDGMKVDITIDNLSVMSHTKPEIKSVYAYSRGTKKNPNGQLYDLCGLYLKVLEDLWEEDRGLNNDIEYVSIDLKNAPGDLTCGEKKAIATIFAERHGTKRLQMNYDELVENGYINKGELFWEDGLIFTISNSIQEDTQYFGLRIIEFDASKWRGGLGAYFFTDCKASFSQNGTWSDYKIGSKAIA